MNGEYIINDVIDSLNEMDNESIAVACLDDAWSRPGRCGAFGVEYDTHSIETTFDVVDEIYRVLEPGGWLLMDSDDWLLPQAIDYIRQQWGDVASTYEGGGYRKVGGVTYVTNDGTPNRSSPGKYFRNAGYHVIFAHKGETDRNSFSSKRQLAENCSRKYDYGSVKPVKPYYNWLKDIVLDGDKVIVPCAGTAPAALACEQLDCDVSWICIDNNKRAYEVFKQRYNNE